MVILSGLPQTVVKKLWKKSRIGLDKSNKLVYNTSMLNEKKTLKVNEMIENLKVALIIGSGIVAVITCAIVSTWILLGTL